MARDSDLLPQPVLLGLLIREPKHGYELYQDYKRGLGCVWRIGLSQLYAQLKQLEEARLVGAEMEPQLNRPPRKVYHLTSEGRQAFLDWLHEPTPYLRRIRIDFLARLYFFRELSLPGLEQLVVAQKAVCQEQADRFARLAVEAEDTFRRLVLEFRRGQLQAVAEWLDRCLAMM